MRKTCVNINRAGDGTHDKKQLKPIERSGTVDKITVYDHEHEIVGETFVRRAKQLVLKGRAKWADNAQSAIMLLNVPADASKEDTKMVNNQEYIDLREAAETPEIGAEPSRDLLMYMAEQNVEKKRNLKRNLIVLPVAFVAALILTDGFAYRHGGLHSYFILGIFFAWFGYVAYKLAKHFLDQLRTRSPKGDPVVEEYERLKRRF